VLAVSISYAYFKRNVIQNGDDTETNITTGLLNVDFLTSQYITNSNAILIEDKDAYNLADKSNFSVERSENNTVEEVYYTLKLSNIEITDNLKSHYFKWRLYETADVTKDTQALSEGDFTTINTDNNTLSLYDVKIPLAKDAVDEFTLIIWLSNDENKNQTELLKGSFNAKVEVTAVNVAD